jgi:hypothetical protein
MSEVIIVRAIETCWACPSQWDAWDFDGNYWYLRYRHGHGTAERQPSPDLDTWAWKEPNVSFTRDPDEGPDGWIELEEFCERAGLNLVLGHGPAA